MDQSGDRTRSTFANKYDGKMEKNVVRRCRDTKLKMTENKIVKLTGLKLGYLLNFGEALLKDGIVRAVNGLEENPCVPASLREQKKVHADAAIHAKKSRDWAPCSPKE